MKPKSIFHASRFDFNSRLLQPQHPTAFYPRIRVHEADDYTLGGYLFDEARTCRRLAHVVTGLEGHIPGAPSKEVAICVGHGGIGVCFCVRCPVSTVPSFAYDGAIFGNNDTAYQRIRRCRILPTSGQFHGVAHERFVRGCEHDEGITTLQRRACFSGAWRWSSGQLLREPV